MKIMVMGMKMMMINRSRRSPIQEVLALGASCTSKIEENKRKRPKALVRESRKPGATEWTNSDLGDYDDERSKRSPLQEVPAYRGSMHLEEKMIRSKNDNSNRPKALVRGSKKTRYYQLDRLDLVAELCRVAKPEGVMGWMVTASG